MNIAINKELNGKGYLNNMYSVNDLLSLEKIKKLFLIGASLK